MLCAAMKQRGKRLQDRLRTLEQKHLLDVIGRNTRLKVLLQGITLGCGVGHRVCNG